MEYLDIIILTVIVSVLYIGFAISLLKASNSREDTKKKS